MTQRYAGVMDIRVAVADLCAAKSGIKDVAERRPANTLALNEGSSQPYSTSSSRDTIDAAQQSRDASLRVDGDSKIVGMLIA
jgi:hypothetical protein